MISYAQNFEDVVLRRVFRNKANGFYIDVGAMDPVADSVTKFFYDQGWCGINIEPNEWFFEKLAAERGRDINLNVAIGDCEEVRTFYAANETGLSSLDPQTRDLFVKRGFQSEERTVTVRTLAAVCREHVDRPIDFLKIDCEGWEKPALAGADWEQFRPTVVVVEATLPGIAVPTWSDWEPILIENAQYDMVYFDGLNRFYLRRDSPGLRTHFNVPPNIFDDFKLKATEVAEQYGQELKRERDDLAGRVAELEQQMSGVVDENQRLAATERLQAGLIAELEKQRYALGQSLLKARLWVGRLSQDVAAGRRR